MSRRLIIQQEDALAFLRQAPRPVDLCLVPDRTPDLFAGQEA